MAALKTIDSALLAQLPLSDIEEVAFYKRDEITTDLICCDIRLGGKIWVFHEEVIGWDLLIRHLQDLPGWRSDWFGSVSLPPFAECRVVAFSR